MSKLLDLTDDSERLKRVEAKADLIISLLRAKPIPPVVEPPSEEPEEPPVNDIIPFTNQFYEGIKSGNLVLESGKTYRVDNVKSTDVGVLRIRTTGKERATLLIGIENYDTSLKTEGEYLFGLKNGSEFYSSNVNFCQPEQIKSSQPWMPALFRSEQNPNAKWTAIIENSDNTVLGRNGGFGLGFVYGGLQENHIAAINYNHVGLSFVDAKNPYKDSVLYLTLDRTKTDGTPKEEFGSGSTLTKGRVESNKLILTGDVDFTVLNNHYWHTDVTSNRAFIAHIGRFTFQLDRVKSLEGNKVANLRPSPKIGDRVKVKDGLVFFLGREPQAGDIFNVDGMTRVIEMKNRTYVDKWTAWGGGDDPELAFQLGCVSDSPIPDGEYIIDAYDSTFNLEGKEESLYLMYKGNQDFRSYPHTKFGDSEIIYGEIVGHQFYNHDKVSIWAKDTQVLGYYRQTDGGEGKNIGVNLINCKGFDDEFNPPVPVTNNPSIRMPTRISSLLSQ